MEEEDNFLDEEQLFFKRFPAEKQDQVRGLVNYATLMGLTGKDLISIGGKLDRLNLAQKIKHNKDIVAGFKLHTIRGTRGIAHDMDSCFRIKTVDGSYRFDAYGSAWRIHSSKTNARKTHDPNDYELGRWNRRHYRYRMLLDIHYGIFQLNF